MVQFIAEIGSNFVVNGGKNIDRIYAIIDKCKEIDCYGVKLQLFKADQLYHPSYKEQIGNNRLRELPLNWIPLISDYCKKVDIKFGLSVFYEDAVDQVKAYVDFLKISSFDILRTSLIEKCVATKLPVIISVGLAKMLEIMALDHKYWNKNITFLHCVSNYPTKPSECYMNFISEIKSISLTQNVGWSDHTTIPGVIYSAISNGASMIEFHVDLDNKLGDESDYGHCWGISRIKEVIKTVKEMEKANSSKLVKNREDREIMIEGNRMWLASNKDGMRPQERYRIYV